MFRQAKPKGRAPYPALAFERWYRQDQPNSEGRWPGEAPTPSVRHAQGRVRPRGALPAHCEGEWQSNCFDRKWLGVLLRRSLASGSLTRCIQSQKDIPVQLLLSSKPVKASLILGSFGATQGLVTDLFDLEITLDPSAPAPAYEKPERYGKKPEIHHIFRADPRSPPKVISLLFALAIVAAVPALFTGVSTCAPVPPQGAVR